MESEEPKKTEKSENMTPYKQQEFEAFISILESGSVSFWQEIAEALGVCKDTITDWQKLPQAIEAKQKGINKCLAEMEKAGEKDWRMWHERLKLLKMVSVDKTDLTSGGQRIGELSAEQSEQLLRARANRNDTERDSE
jgi:hypothetical protein